MNTREIDLLPWSGVLCGLVLVLGLGVSACHRAVAPPSLPPVVVQDNACSWARIITVDRLHDVMTDETAKEIKAHNDAVKTHCGADAKRGLAKP